MKLLKRYQRKRYVKANYIIISVGQISGRPKICWSNWSGRIGRIGQTGQTGQIGQVYFKYNILFYNNHLTNLTSTNPLTGLVKLVKLVWSNGQTGLVKPTLMITICYRLHSFYITIQYEPFHIVYCPDIIYSS